jgi:hypothetical protein
MQKTTAEHGTIASEEAQTLLSKKLKTIQLNLFPEESTSKSD